MQKKQMGQSSTPIMKTSPVKMSYSVNNLIFLFIIAVGIFVVYRYVKSLETELKVVRKEIQSMKIVENKPIEAATPSLPKATDAICMMNVTHPEHRIVDDELESVSSEEIMKIIDDIDNEENEEDEMDIVSTHKETTESAHEQVEEPLEDEEDEIVLKKSHTDDGSLMKKTNEELKQILKEQGKNTKGTKAELVKRITEEL